MKRRYRLINRYIGTEYIISFLVSFVFFFFIFFINQILVLAQRIMLKNVQLNDVLLLVVLSIPQFLMYTMPFSSLASASMVIGNFSSDNEILAMRANGINIKKIFKPIVILSLVLSFVTIYIADVLIPFTANAYKELYAKILEDIPTLELDSYSSTQFGSRVISNGLVKDNIIHDVLILDDSDPQNSRVITASEASISVVDLDRFIYRIDLKNPEILMTDATSLETYSAVKADDLSLFLNLSNNDSEYATLTPSQMGIRELAAEIKDKGTEQNELLKDKQISVATYANRLGNILLSTESGELDETLVSDLTKFTSRFYKAVKGKTYSFYYQYYRAEYNKKFALSFACTFLVFLAFPISFFKIKYGKLVGFGLSMLLACFYWFFIYFMHSCAIDSALNPAVYLWAPDLVVFLAGLVLLKRLMKH